MSSSPIKMPQSSVIEAPAPSLLDKIAEQQAIAATRYRPVMSVQDSIQRYHEIEKFVGECMKEGVDYGKPPGFPRESKPFLYKAGAQKLCAFFGYVPHYTELECIEEWMSEKYGEPLFYYKFSCALLKGADPVGEGIGSCNSWESKYRYRNSSRVCPQCGAEAIIKGKAEYGGGFLCFAKKGGCGAKFKDDDQSILEQEAGKVPNPDISDVINTVQKQGEKRAYVEATLSATGASAFFTQDEDTVEPPKRTPPQSTTKGSAPRPAAAQKPSQPAPEPNDSSEISAWLDRLTGDPKGDGMVHGEIVVAIENQSDSDTADKAWGAAISKCGDPATMKPKTAALQAARAVARELYADLEAVREQLPE